MRLASFRIAGRDTWGIVEGSQAADVGSVLQRRYADLKALLAAGALAEAAASKPQARWYPLTELERLSVIPNLGKSCVSG